MRRRTSYSSPYRVYYSSRRPHVPEPEPVSYQAIDEGLPRSDPKLRITPDLAAHILRGATATRVDWPFERVPYPVVEPDAHRADPPAPLIEEEMPPKPTLADFLPRRRIVDYLLGERWHQRENMARAELAGAERGWEERSNQLSALRDAFERRSREWQEYNQEFEEDLLKAIDGWKSASAAWDRARTAACERLESFRASYLNREPSAIMRYADIVLALSQWPAEFPRDATTGYDAEAKILVAELRLPNFDEITVLKPKGWELRAANQRETERTRRQVLYALCLRSLYELAANDEIAVFDSIACNGWIRFTDRATGHQRSEVVLSVHATRCQLLEINIGEVDAEAAFRALKGLAAPKLDAHVPVAPILRINRDDKRIVPGRDVLEALNDAANLAAMDWEDFEHLIRQVFELEWAHEGAEVRVTQASRDKGVDALIFDPDPLRGGKFVIQAKRYTRVVDVSAVRDLYGTVVNEGANRGILVTTSSYGPDAYEFAKGKPLTLLTGANLLQLLDKHGYRFRINLEEARALALDQG